MLYTNISAYTASIYITQKQRNKSNDIGKMIKYLLIYDSFLLNKA
jgi:hypothetical protein